MSKQAELVAAYHTVMVEARNVLALQRRITMLLGAANQDGDKLADAIAAAQTLEVEVGLEQLAGSIQP